MGTAKAWPWPWLALIAGALVLLMVGGFFFFKGRIVGSQELKGPRSWNVLMITLDTTRADRLGCYGYQAGCTPNLDELSSSGVRFQNAYCQVPLTLPSHASILTGINPCRHGVHNNGNYALSPESTTLAEILQEQGLKTAAFVASFSVDSRFGLDQGFETYDDSFEPGKAFKSYNAERPAD